jgi:hypothetical protein
MAWHIYENMTQSLLPWAVGQSKWSPTLTTQISSPVPLDFYLYLGGGGGCSHMKDQVYEHTLDFCLWCHSFFNLLPKYIK